MNRIIHNDKDVDELIKNKFPEIYPIKYPALAVGSYNYEDQQYEYTFLALFENALGCFCISFDEALNEIKKNTKILLINGIQYQWHQKMGVHF